MTLPEKIKRNLQIIEEYQSNIKPGEPTSYEILAGEHALLLETTNFLLVHVRDVEAEANKLQEDKATLNAVIIGLQEMIKRLSIGK